LVLWSDGSLLVRTLLIDADRPAKGAFLAELLQTNLIGSGP
jgi:hypothetical protein